MRDAIHAVRDWDRVLAIARAGSVGESIWAALLVQALEKEIPEPARAAFEEDHGATTARNAVLLTDAAALQQALEEVGIESIILKGPGLIVAHYPDIGGRHTGDVDVLVRKADIPGAQAVARGLGARPAPPAESLQYDGRIEWREPGNSDNHVAALHTPAGTPLEIHWSVPGGELDGSDVEGI